MIRYTNHLGDSVTLGDGGIYHTFEHDLYGTSWDYDSATGDPASLSLKPAKLKLPIGIGAESEEEGSVARRRLHDLLATDSMARTAGTVERDGYSMPVVPVSIADQKWWYSDRFCETTVELLAAHPVWSRETVWQMHRDESAGIEDGFDYPFDYPIDYAYQIGARTLDNSQAIDACRFKLTVYGPATSPSIRIGGNIYQVACDVASYGVLVIDSRLAGIPNARPIALYDAQGNETNAFPRRNRGLEGSGSYIFQRIPKGSVDVTWDGTFGFDLAIYDERPV